MKKIIDNIRQNYKLVIVLLIVGVLLGWLFFHPSKKDINAATTEQTGHEGHDHAQDAVSIWTCSMHPQIKRDKPGKCPICAMDLIPLNDMQSDQEDIDPNEIQMTESAAKLADIQTLLVKRGKPTNEIFLQGKVQPDERRVSELTARFGGRIEKLYINFTGENVSKGEKLATIYSPELVTAQRELLEAVGYKDIRPELYAAARGKLRLWDLNDSQIAAIEKNGEPQLYFDILAPISGTVMKRQVALGDYVKVGSPLFEVIDLTHLWILFDAYESDLPWINKGDNVSYTLQSLPGKSFTGKIAFIDPFINASTRVAKVRIEQNNMEMMFKPEMFVNGIIESETSESSNEILIPKTSILWTGKRAVVFVKVPERDFPTFRYREIVLGPESGNFYVVSSGLEEGEEIAVNGVFKIDASAQLAGKQSMMNPDGEKVALPHNHAEMTGDEEHSKSESMDMNISSSDIPMEFRDQLQKVYNSYVLMTDAFIASNAKAVSKNAKKVKSDLAEVGMELLKGDSHMAWMKQLDILKKEIDNIVKSSEIAEQRISYSTFNDAFYQSLKTFGIDSGTVYYQYCPMANGDKGAFWFSNIKEIRNPYFGDEMLQCGETKDTLVFNK